MCNHRLTLSGAVAIQIQCTIPMQINFNFKAVKIDDFRMKNCDSSLIFARCNGFVLSTPTPCFRANIKNSVYPYKPLVLLY